MSRTLMSLFVFGLQATSAAAVVGCAAATPPAELVSARRAYDQARAGQAQDLVPAEVLSARQALEKAERSFRDDPESQRTRDLAYVALRRAQLADTRGALAADRRDEATAEKDISQLRAWQTQRAQSELSASRAEVAAQKQVMAAQQRQLTSEERARHEAERRAAAAIASLEKIAAVKDEARGMVITLNGSVLFATNQSTLLPIAQDRLAQVAAALNESPEGSIVVEGHTDSRGPQSLNDELSKNRAEAVRTFLVQKGVDASRIRSVGLGPSRPVADNNTAEGRANNRRVEIVIERH
ncbi:Flagellar motor rotation protein MotB [Minicystis rosea]|nr:Flagellar motor rotation protein MotB [Minicystis rosea]